MESQKVKWGILGPGIIAHEFVQDFAHVDNAEVIAVASRSKDRGESFANKYGIPKAYSGYNDLYQDSEIDCIYVATPHNFHLEQVSAAMEAGKAVLCEKPITVTPQELEELITLSKAKNTYLAEGMWTYFLPAIRKAKEWIEQGRIGRILHIKSDFGYPVPFNAESRYYNPKLAGGSLLDMGVYTVAMAWFFLQQHPSKIDVNLKKAKTGVDLNTLMNFTYESHSAVLHSSFECKLNNHSYVIGEKGYIDIPEFWRARTCDLYQLEERIEVFDDHRLGNGFEYEIATVSNDLLSGKKQSNVVPFNTSRALQKHMFDVLEQARRNESQS